MSGGFGGSYMSQDTCYSADEFSGGNEGGHAEEDFVTCVKVVECPSHYKVSFLAVDKNRTCNDLMLFAG